MGKDFPLVPSALLIREGARAPTPSDLLQVVQTDPGPVTARFQQFTPVGYLNGLGLAFVDTDNITIAVGSAASDDALETITVLAPITVDLSASGLNGLDIGVEAPTTFYAVYVIKNSVTGAVGGLFSLSFSAPTLPTGFDLQRRIGSVRNNGTSDIRMFDQFGSGHRREIRYTDEAGTRFVLIGGVAVVATDVSAATLVPPSTEYGILEFRTNGSLFGVLYQSAALFFVINVLRNDNELLTGFPLTTNTAGANSFAYRMIGGGSMNIFVAGYTEDL